MKMTFAEYIQNPAGKHNAVFSQREMYKTIYTQKLDKLLLKENNKIDYWLYTKGENYYIHIKIPSEVVDKFYYDVVVRFFPSDNNNINETSLKNYSVQFFSNSPDFVYTYAHTFIEKELFIEDLKPRMDRIAVKQAANIRNPNNVVGYVKGFYFTYLIMVNRGLFTKSKFKLYAKKYDKKELLKNVEDSATKIEKRLVGERKQRKKAKKENKKETKKNNKASKSSIKTTPKTKRTIRKTSVVGKK